jgi:hypothetical protein
MHELGFGDEFRSLLQNEITPLDVVIGKRRFTPDRRSTLPAGRSCPGIASSGLSPSIRISEARQPVSACSSLRSAPP